MQAVVNRTQVPFTGFLYAYSTRLGFRHILKCESFPDSSIVFEKLHCLTRGFLKLESYVFVCVHYIILYTAVLLFSQISIAAGLKMWWKTGYWSDRPGISSECSGVHHLSLSPGAVNVALAASWSHKCIAEVVFLLLHALREVTLVLECCCLWKWAHRGDYSTRELTASLSL